MNTKPRCLFFAGRMLGAGLVMFFWSLRCLTADVTLAEDWSDTCPDCHQTIRVSAGSPAGAVDAAIAAHRASCPGKSGGSSSSSSGYDYEAERRDREEREARERAAAEREQQRLAAAKKADDRKKAEAAYADFQDADRMAQAPSAPVRKKKNPKTSAPQAGQPPAGWRKCNYCKGSGEEPCGRSGCQNGRDTCGCVNAANGYKPNPKCRDCGGSGQVQCDNCQGSGKVSCSYCVNGWVPASGIKPAAGAAAGQKSASSAVWVGAATAPVTVNTPGAQNKNAVIARMGTSISTQSAHAQRYLSDVQNLKDDLNRSRDRLAARPKATPPPGIPTVDDLKKANDALARRELELIQAGLDRAGGDVPRNPAEMQILLAEIKKSFRSDPERMRLWNEARSLEQKVLKSSQKSAVGDASASTSTFSQPLPPDELRKRFRDYEDYVWWKESMVVEGERYIAEADDSIRAYLAAERRIRDDYEKLRGQQGTPPTFQAYLAQRQKTDVELILQDKNVAKRAFIYERALQGRPLQLAALAGKQDEYRNLVESDPQAAVIAREVHAEKMRQRTDQLNGIIRAERVDIAVLDRQQEPWDKAYEKASREFYAYQDKFLLEASADYAKLPDAQRKNVNFDDFAEEKASKTPEFVRLSEEYQKAQTEKYLFDFDITNVRGRNDESTRQIKNLQENGTLLNDRPTHSVDLKKLRPDRDYSNEPDYLNYILRAY